jgi:hypothetical protein
MFVKAAGSRFRDAKVVSTTKSIPELVDSADALHSF